MVGYLNAEKEEEGIHHGLCESPEDERNGWVIFIVLRYKWVKMILQIS